MTRSTRAVAAMLTALLLAAAGATATSAAPARRATIGLVPAGGLGGEQTGQTSCGACIVTMRGERTFSAPKAGMVTAFSAVLDGPGRAGLVVLRPLAGRVSAFTVIARSTPLDLPAEAGPGIVHAPTRLAVRAGDVLGIELTGGATVLSTTLSGVEPTISTSPDAAPGQTTALQQSQSGNTLLAAATLSIARRNG